MWLKLWFFLSGGYIRLILLKLKFFIILVIGLVDEFLYF